MDKLWGSPLLDGPLRECLTTVGRSKLIALVQMERETQIRFSMAQLVAHLGRWVTNDLSLTHCQRKAGRALERQALRILAKLAGEAGLAEADLAWIDTHCRRNSSGRPAQRRRNEGASRKRAVRQWFGKREGEWPMTENLRGSAAQGEGRFDGHRLLQLTCNERSHTDTTLCECGWQKDFVSVGSAFAGWLIHADAALASQESTRCRHCGGTKDSPMPLSGAGSRCFDKWHQESTPGTQPPSELIATWRSRSGVRDLTGEYYGSDFARCADELEDWYKKNAAPATAKCGEDEDAQSSRSGQ